MRLRISTSTGCWPKRCWLPGLKPDSAALQGGSGASVKNKWPRGYRIFSSPQEPAGGLNAIAVRDSHEIVDSEAFSVGNYYDIFVLRYKKLGLKVAHINTRLPEVEDWQGHATTLNTIIFRLQDDGWNVVVTGDTSGYGPVQMLRYDLTRPHRVIKI